MNVKKTLSAMAQDLYSVNAINETILTCFNQELPVFSPNQIISLREKLGLNQILFAAYLNISNKVVKRWEQGKAKPTGATLKLLSILEKKGLDIFA